MLQSKLDNQRVLNLLRAASQQPQIRRMVEDNHDNNRWWPLEVADPRIRMAVAGWSSRVSYAMIATYQEVVDRTASIGWDSLIELTRFSTTRDHRLSWAYSIPHRLSAFFAGVS